VVITSNKAPLLAENMLKKATDRISKWAEENRFEISSEKTKTMIIYHRRPKIGNGEATPFIRRDV
jgi:hypothetical protein